MRQDSEYMRQRTRASPTFKRQNAPSVFHPSLLDVLVGASIIAGFYALFWFSFAIDVMIAGG